MQTATTIASENGAESGTAAAPLAHQAIHDTVIGILERLPRGALLDVPAGEGGLGARLIEAGFEVSFCDLYPEIFWLNNRGIRRGDLNHKLPFDDSSF